jgi:peptidoglycan/xylan/chitin deacetylase (PgdA/CDA1 family)/GT2 family glycosyltransferase
MVDERPAPDLTVVVPSRDSGPKLDATLAGLAAQRDVAGRLELVLVDDGSRVAIPADLAAPGRAFPVRVVRRDVSGGIAVARNAGWRVAKGRIVLFLDDDIALGDSVLAAHLAAHDGPGIRIGVGRLRTEAPPDADWMARRFEDLWNAHIDALDAGRPLRPSDAFGGDLSVPVSALARTGGFDERLPRSEDLELAARLVADGAELVYVRGEALHREHKTGRALLDDARKNGRVAADVVARHPWLLVQTELGSYAAVGQRQLALRRLLTAGRVRAADLARLVGWAGAGRRGRAAASLLIHQAFWSGVRDSSSPEGFGRLTDGVAVLMYHAFALPGEPASRYVCRPDRFRAQLTGLLRAGRTPLALGDYLRMRAAFALPPRGSFLVTIDDGYADVETVALPILRDLGVPATVFLVAGRIGAGNTWDSAGAVSGRPTLSAAAVERLRVGGVELGVHSMTHRPLDGLPADVLAEEVDAARDRLEATFGGILPAFAFPYGRADDAAREAVVRAGMVGFGVRDGLATPASNDAELPRIEVRGGDAPRRVRLAASIGGTRRLVHR